MFAQIDNPFTEKEFRDFIDLLQSTDDNDLMKRFLIAIENDRSAIISEYLKLLKSKKTK